MKNFSHLLGVQRCGLRRFVAISGLAVIALTAFAQSPSNAQQFDKPVVIELFTSQGCSSCPPADRLLGQIARKPNVFALTLPVDYWDYIGWKDTFAAPAFTARQKAYASARRDSHVYTPQAVVDGLHHAVGSDASAIASAASQAKSKGALNVAMETAVQGDKVICNLGDGVAGGPASAGLFLFRIVKSRQVQIGRGENRGRSVTYVNIVRSMVQVGVWSGKAKQITIPASVLKTGDAEGWVLMLQAGTAARPGVVLAAAKAKGF